MLIAYDTLTTKMIPYTQITIYYKISAFPILPLKVDNTEMIFMHKKGCFDLRKGLLVNLGFLPLT